MLRHGVRNLSVPIVEIGEGFILVPVAVTVVALLLSLEQSPLYNSVATVNTWDFTLEEPVVLES